MRLWGIERTAWMVAACAVAVASNAAADDGGAHRLDRYVHRPAKASSRAWEAFLRDHGTQWQAVWDEGGRRPARVWGHGLSVPGGTSDAAAADRAARILLDRQRALFAPGTRPGDFSLVSNQLTPAGVRVVGYLQHHLEVPILDAQWSVRLVRDRIVVIGSETVGHPQGRVPARSLSERSLGAHAMGAVEGASQLASLGPLAFHSLGQGDLVAVRVAIVVADGKRYQVRVAAADGTVVLVQPLFEEGSAHVDVKVPIRSWHLGYHNVPMPPLHVDVGGGGITSAGDGAVDFPGSSAPASFQVEGPHARIINEAGANYEQPVTLVDGTSYIWKADDFEFEDAQLSALIHVYLAKEFARTVDPTIAWLDEQMNLYVNEDNVCNAWSDHNDLHFYRAGSGCGNTARVPDVVYHEFGHSLYHALRIEGVGQWTRSYTEGLADYYAVSMTGDPAWGQGFVNQVGPTRHCDPAGVEKRWPEDTGNYYEDGIIYCGAMFDLRKALIARYGEEEGARRMLALFFDSARTLRDIPTSFVEMLAADDDDGNLANGTPHGCEILTAFAIHGLADPRFDFRPRALEPYVDGATWKLPIELPASCGSDSLDDVQLEWRVLAPEDGSLVDSGTLDLGSEGEQVAELQRPAWGSLVEYRIHYSVGGESKILPDTAAAPWYQAFVGQAEPIYCNGFESPDDLADWTHEATAGVDNWSVDTPTGANLDPRDAYEGTGVVGTATGIGDHLGAYGHHVTSRLTSPVVDVSGYDYVHLQYRRYLSVEDAKYDVATLQIDGSAVWQNAEGDGDAHHFDREWRFHDVDLSEDEDGEVQLAFTIDSDGAKHFGGWNIDALCIVGYRIPECGDGQVEGFEECDDGNAVDDDDCSNACERPVFEPDAGAGPMGDGGGGGAGAGDETGGCGCRTSSGSTAALWWLPALALWGWRRRRRSE